MIFPKAIKKGACVGLIAPASPVTKEEAFCSVKVLEKEGFSVLVGDTLRENANVFGYLAGEAKARAADFNRMFANPQVEAIFCVRGGYGSIQMLEYLDYGCIRKNPKIFTGYSDVTSLHCAIQKNCGLITFHGPMVKTDLLLEESDYTWKNLYGTWGAWQQRFFQNPPGEELQVIRSGRARGHLIGGNLAVLTRLLGTPYVPEFEGGILFLEEIGEKIPRIDMYLTQLELSGILRSVQGVLLGGFRDCFNTGYEDSLKVEDFLRKWFGRLEIPVMGNVCSDHRHPMGTLSLGCLCEMDTEQKKITFFREQTEEKQIKNRL